MNFWRTAGSPNCAKKKSRRSTPGGIFNYDFSYTHNHLREQGLQSFLHLR